MKQIIWKGFYSAGSGISNATLAMVNSLKTTSMDFKILPLKPVKIEGFEIATKEDEENGFNILHQLPTVGPDLEGYYSVTEFDICPPEWWYSLIKSKVLLTQSEFCRSSFKKIPGIDKSKIHVVNFPLSDNFTSEGANLRARIKNAKSGMFLEDYDFVFGSVFEWVARKKPELMWEAFMKAFPYKEFPGVAFINKISVPGGVPHSFRDWKSKLPRDPRIMVFREHMHNIAAFYRSLDGYCSPTAGEGWGATLAEAMACGLPTIGSKHSGNLDFMNDTNSYLVDVGKWTNVGDDPVNVIPHIVHDYQRWKLPKVDSIVKAMKEIYDLKMSGKPNHKAREAIKIRGKLTYENTGKQLEKALTQYL